MNHIIEPHGGKLCELMVSEAKRKQLQQESFQYPSLTLNDRQLCDVEMLLNGGFSPLKGFLGQVDYESVLEENRLSDNAVWPIPITLDISEEFSSELNTGDKIVLRDHEGVALGILNISDKWTPDRKEEAKKVGLIFLEHGKSRYGVYRFRDCKHKQEMQFSNVRGGNFICNVCEETSRSLPSKVYLLHIKVGSEEWLKLGYAKVIRSRIKKYKLPSNSTIKRMKVLDFATGREAHEYEASLHKKYIRKRLPIKKMKQFFQLLLHY